MVWCFLSSRSQESRLWFKVKQQPDGLLSSVHLELLRGYNTSANLTEFHMHRICSEMLLHSVMAQRHPKANTLILRYEDMSTNFDENLRALLEFLEVRMTPEKERAIQRVKGKEFAVFKHDKLPDKQVHSVSALETLARSIPVCRDLIQRHSY
eukprot:m.519915 g.519915  ORF g.519915 m.519915 type:complete len:153 (-) comp57492_c0_seq7:482-940(-)